MSISRLLSSTSLKEKIVSSSYETQGNLFSGLDIYGEVAQPSDNSIRYESYSGNKNRNENS